MLTKLAYMILLPFVMANQTDLSLGQSYTALCIGTGGVYGPASAAYKEQFGKDVYYACSYLEADK